MINKNFAVTLATCLATCLATQGTMADAIDELTKYEYGAPGEVGQNVEKLLSDTAPADYGALETQLIALVASPEATQTGKAFACRALQRIGSDKAVPVLSGLLNDEVLSHYARLVLERLKSPAANKALRDALGSAPDTLKVGLLGSLGESRDANSLKEIRAQVSNGDAAVAAAAMQALGKLGGKDAAKYLVNTKVPEGLVAAQMQAIIDCAGTLSGAASEQLYEQVLKSGTPPTKVAAFTQLMSTDSPKAATLISDAIKGDDAKLLNAAVGIVASTKGKKVTRAALSLLDSISPDKKAKVLVALGQRGDKTALPKIIASVKDVNALIRDSAISALSAMNDASVVKVLLGMANSEQVGARALQALHHMTGKDVDQALIDALNDKALKAAAISTLAARGTTSAAKAVLTLLADSDEQVRKAAWNGVCSLAGEEDISAIMQQLAGIQNAKELASAHKAVKIVCGQAKDKAGVVKIVAGYYDKVSESTQALILDLGVLSGDADILQLEQKALRSTNTVLRGKALRVLAAWPNAGAAPDLLAVAKNGDTDVDKILALRGYIRLAKEGLGFSSRDQVAMLKNAASLCERPDEKRLVINSLRGTTHADAFALLSDYMNDAALKGEAEIAAAELAWNLRWGFSKEVAAMADELAKSENASVQTKARATLADTSTSSSYLRAWLANGPLLGDALSLYDGTLGPEKDAASVKWSLLGKGVGETSIDLLQTYGARQNACAYLTCTIVAPADMSAKLSMGSDDGIKAWVNGALVHAWMGRRSIVPDQDVVNITLKKGENSLLLKIVQMGGGWGFSCRILGEDNMPIPALNTFTQY